ncbi:hypothetical protein [Pseudomonas sp. 18173]|uniref:hypothetical protein n=1 Tax=Pseudomonas sp. 18173 TaxID=3390055 RepID=UPI003D228602
MTLQSRVLQYQAVIRAELESGVEIGELSGVIARMAELHVAGELNGQLPTVVHQSGFDVIAKNGERVSVKSIARMGFDRDVPKFNPRTQHHIDRAVIVAIDPVTAEPRIIYNALFTELKPLLNANGYVRLHRVVAAEVIHELAVRAAAGGTCGQVWPAYDAPHSKDEPVSVAKALELLQT